MSYGSNGTAFYFDAVRSLAFGSISGAYANLGAVTAFPGRSILIQNLTDVQLTFSFYEPTVDNLTLPSMGYIVIDIGTNRQATSDRLCLPVNTQISVKATGGNPTLGAAYATLMYGN